MNQKRPRDYRANRANRVVDRALKSGKLKMSDKCEVCGRSESTLPNEHKRNICAHHDDYSKPLVVRWLCLRCHRQWHRLNTAGPDHVASRGIKLSDQQIEEIRYLHKLGLSRPRIANKIGCSRRTVWILTT